MTTTDRWRRLGTISLGGVTYVRPELPPLAEGICPTCRGAGFLVADVPYGHPRFAELIPCSCKQADQQQRRQVNLEQLSNLAAFRDRAFAAFDLDMPGVHKAFLRAHAFAQQPQGWLLLFGPCGVGKTHLAAAVANQALDRGDPALFTVVPDLLDPLRATFRPTSAEGCLDGSPSRFARMPR